MKKKGKCEIKTYKDSMFLFFLIMYVQVKVVDLNPKTMPTEDLYGHISMSTREWKDGLLSSIMRDLGQILDEKPKWMLLDGDLDANWIESMNSVMDDNKMLTLASNERIPLKVSLNFSCHDSFHIARKHLSTHIFLNLACFSFFSTATYEDAV